MNYPINYIAILRPFPCSKEWKLFLLSISKLGSNTFISKHFYKQKMLSQVTFGGFPTSLINVSQF